MPRRNLPEHGSLKRLTKTIQQLPLHVKSRVLKEGNVRFARDEDALYAVAIRAVRAFEGFRHHYRAYLDEELVLGTVRDRLADVGIFKREVLDFRRGL